jgi:hypothetical protein
MGIQVTPIPRLTTLTTPAFTLGTANAAGDAITAVASNSTILVYDASSPANIAASASVGSSSTAARRDHVHGGFTQSSIAALEAETNEDTYAPPDLLRYARSTSSVWCRDSGGGADSGSMNISSVSHDSTGQDTYSFSTALENADVNSYVLGQSGGGDSTASVSGTSTSSVTVKKWTAGSLTNQAGFMACFGDLA